MPPASAPKAALVRAWPSAAAEPTGLQAGALHQGSQAPEPATHQPLVPKKAVLPRNKLVMHNTAGVGGGRARGNNMEQEPAVSAAPPAPPSKFKRVWRSSAAPPKKWEQGTAPWLPASSTP
jgi:hypothetical protein